MGSGMPFNVD